MSELSTEIEWLDGGDIADRVHATYARLVLRFGGTAVTRIRDVRTRSDRDSIHVSVYPLAEWLAQNWFSLRLEGENRWRDGRAFSHRHQVPTALDGFYFPALQVAAEGERVRLRWSPRMLEARMIEFIEQGQLTCGRDVFDAFAADLIERVIARLNDLGLGDTGLEREWNAIQALSADEVRFANAAARLGSDPFDIGETDVGRIERVAASLPEDLQDDVLALVTPDDFDRQLAWFTAAVGRLEDRAGSAGLRDLKASLSDALRHAGRKPPHAVGEAAAERLRHEMGLGIEPLDGIDHLRALFHVSDQSLSFSDQLDQRVDSLTRVDAERRPAFLVAKKREDSRMFALGRGIYEFLLHADRDWNVVTDLRTPRGQESRAFAAYFLCPPDAIRRFVAERGLNAVDDDAITEIAETYHVSTFVVGNHLENHKLAPTPN